MDTIQISTGLKRVSIKRDNEPEGFIEFNPTDIVFAEKFYALIGEFKGKQAEYETKFNEIDANTGKDSDDLPVNLPDKLALLRDVCEYMRSKIDDLFGAGTSKIAFGDSLTLDVFAQFFEGVTPFIQTARSEKVTKYQRHSGSKVMK